MVPQQYLTFHKCFPQSSAVKLQLLLLSYYFFSDLFQIKAFEEHLATIEKICKDSGGSTLFLTLSCQFSIEHDFPNSMDIFMSFYVTTTHGFTEKRVLCEKQMSSPLLGQWVLEPGATHGQFLQARDSVHGLIQVRGGEGMGMGMGGRLITKIRICVSKQGRPDL